jgi:plasmid rolling circle replication initiator protein Rep
MAPSRPSLPRADRNFKPEPKSGIIRLAELSPDDRPWDRHGADAQEVMKWFSGGDDWQYGKSERMEACGQRLLFAIHKEGRHRLKTARFCRIRLCPRCQWRRSLAWKARWYHAWPELQKVAPKARYFHLVLTLPNVPVTELRGTILRMSNAWKRMVCRNTWPALGFVRATEVTIETKRSGYVHPHFHILMMVKPSYFKGDNYMSADAWKEYWASALGMKKDELLKPYIRSIDPSGGIDALASAVKEVFKYAVKGMEPKRGKRLDWVPTFLEMDRQLKGTQATSLGGILREVFRGEEDITEEEMMAQTEEPEEETLSYWEYVWSFSGRYYHRSRILDQQESDAIVRSDMERADKERRAKGPLPEPILASDSQRVDWEIQRACIGSSAGDGLHQLRKEREGRQDGPSEVSDLSLERQVDGGL